MRTCEAPGCAEKHLARGMCAKHYAVWRRTSAPSGRTCSVEGCSRRHSSHGYCDNHAKNFRKFGSPEAPRLRRAEVGYAGAHYRVRLLRGAPAVLRCEHCSGAAQEWAYDHLDASELTYDSPKGAIAYSVDPIHYLALCKPCHTRFDRAQNKDAA